MGKLFVANSTGTAMDNQTWEIDPDTLTVGSGIVSPGPNGRGIGGFNNRLFWVDVGSFSVIHELDPITRVSINSLSHSNGVQDIGGAAGILFAADNSAGQLRVVNPDTLAYGTSRAIGGIVGVGGTATRGFYITGTDTIQEFNPVTLADIGSAVANPGAGNTRGIGGFDERLFIGNQNPSPSVIYEIDPDSLGTIINSNDPISTPDSGFLISVGGFTEVTGDGANLSKNLITVLSTPY